MTLNSNIKEEAVLIGWLMIFALIVAGPLAAMATRRLTGSKQTPFAAMIAGNLLMEIWAALVLPHGLLVAATCVLAWALLVLSAVDAAVFRLPDVVSLPLLALGLGVSWFLPDRDLTGHVIGALCGLASFFAIAEVYRRTRGREGLGLGDAKLAGAAGAWLGWQALPSVVLLACCAGLVWVGLGVMRRGKAVLTERIPFGVALCFAIWVVWLYGPLEIFGPMD